MEIRKIREDFDLFAPELSTHTPIEYNAETDLLGELACHFMEEEIGHRDWIANWKIFKSGRNGDLLERAKAWLYQVGHDVSLAEKLVQHCEELTTTVNIRYR